MRHLFEIPDPAARPPLAPAPAAQEQAGDRRSAYDEHTYPGFDVPEHGKLPTMLRKVLWSAVLAGFTGAAAMGTRAAATRIWRLATGEDPPVKQ